MSAPLHHRTVIRNAAVKALIDASTSAGSRVYDHPWNERTTLPAIVVEDIGESQGTTTFGAGAARHVDRSYDFEVIAELQPLDDMAATRDDLLAQIEAAIAGMQAPGLKAVVPMGYAAEEASAGGRPVVVGRQRFQATYITPMNNPAEVR